MTGSTYSHRHMLLVRINLRSLCHMFSWSPVGLQVSNHELVLTLVRAKSAAKLVVCALPIPSLVVRCNVYTSTHSSGLYSTLQYPHCFGHSTLSLSIFFLSLTRLLSVSCTCFLNSVIVKFIILVFATCMGRSGLFLLCNLVTTPAVFS